MENLEEQLKKRERMVGSKPKRAAIKRNAKAGNEGISQAPDLIALVKKIAGLEAENSFLKLQLAKLGDQPIGQPRLVGFER